MSLEPAAIGIIFNDDKTKILLVRRKDIPVWVLPGGGIDENETPEQAVIREVQEETGFNVLIERKCAEYTPTNRLGAFTNVFVCCITGGQPSLSEETTGVEFHPLDALPSLFFSVHKKWLEDALTHTTLFQGTLTGVNYLELIKCLIKHPWYTLRYIITRIKKKSE
jgi:8-oxo-dGTP diphosphatase